MDLALAHGERAHHQGAMGNGFIARHAEVAGECARGAGKKRLQMESLPSIRRRRYPRLTRTTRRANYLLTGPADHGNWQRDFRRPLPGGSTRVEASVGIEAPVPGVRRSLL